MCVRVHTAAPGMSVQTGRGRKGGKKTCCPTGLRDQPAKDHPGSALGATHHITDALEHG